MVAGRVRAAVDDDDRVLGFATWRPTGADAELDDLFVEPHAMRRGLGGALVDDAADQAAQAGHSRLLVVGHARTRAFYEREGFADVGPATTRFGLARRFARELAGETRPE
jgi:GNAT superfamily N-acetyltransferase